MGQVVTVDENDEVVGTMSREEAHKNSTPHRISVVYVENDNGEILIQRRASGRLDHFSAGHVDPGETYEEAAHRELKEELGITDISLSFVGKGRSEVNDDEREQYFVHFFEVFVCTAEPGELHPDEVQEVFWKDPEDILDDMKNNPKSKTYSPGFRDSLPLYLKQR